MARVDLQNPDSSSAAQQVAPSVLIVTLKGKLGTTELARCHRSIREAETNGCNYVVFRLEDAGATGESVADLQSLMDRIQSTEVPTIAVLSGRVTQGAAALALCTTESYMLKGAVWGEVAKPEKDFLELIAEDPEAAQSEKLDAMVAMMRARLDQRRNKLRPDAAKLAMAMVDPRIQLVSATVREGGIERPRIMDRAELAALQKAGATIIGDEAMVRW